jgi:2-methylcitrate dehydratase PrpD
LTLKDHSVRERVVAHPRGTGDRVLSDADIVAKYRSLTASVINSDRQAAIEKMVLSLESLDDISELTALLTPTVRPALN